MDCQATMVRRKTGAPSPLYPGAVQWLAAVENPPHLKAMAPGDDVFHAAQFFYSGACSTASLLEWIWNNIAPDIRKRKNLAGPRELTKRLRNW